MRGDGISTIGSDYIQLVCALVDGGFETPLWGTFLDRLRHLTNANFAVLNFRHPGRPFAEEVLLMSGMDNISPEQLSADYPAGDPPVDETLTEERVYSHQELIGSSGPGMFRDYLEAGVKQGMSGFRLMRVQESSGVHGWLSITRLDGSDFSRGDGALMQSLAGVLRASLRNYIALEREKYKAALIAEPVRRMEFGWITLDESGKILDHDEQAAAMLARSSVLRRTSAGRIAARSRDIEREIYRILAEIAKRPSRRAEALRLSSDPWLDMLIMPARKRSISASAAPTAIAYIHGDSWRSADRSDQLKQLFGLSAQQARLALALCRGMTIAEAAAEFGLAVGTARNYSQTIFAKTGARGQPDLVRIIMRSVLAIAPDA